MKKPKVLFFGDYNDKETVEMLQLFCDKYSGEYDVLASGYNYNKLRENKNLAKNCRIVGMSNKRFIYYKHLAKYVIITSPAPRFQKEKRNQEIIYVISEFDLNIFPGVVGDISRIVTDSNDVFDDANKMFNHISVEYVEDKRDAISNIISSGDVVDLSDKELLIVRADKQSGIRDKDGAYHYVKNVAENPFGTVIALSNMGGVEDATSNISFLNKDRTSAILTEFDGKIIFYDEESKAFFFDYIKKEEVILLKAKEYINLEDLKFKLMEDTVGKHKTLKWNDTDSEYVKYRTLVEELYDINECEKNKVSIVICMYNTPYELLSRGIRSALNTGHDNVEVIVVDDGSDKNLEKEINNEFTCGRVYYYYKENEGPGLSREYGIEKAQGKYVFFLDSDDTIHPGGMRCLVSHAEYFGLNMVIGKRVLCDENGVPINESLKNLYKNSFQCYYKESIGSAIYSDVMVNNLLIKKEFLEKTGLKFQKGLYEDVEYTAKIYSLCPEFHYLNIAIHDWYQYGKSTTISSTPSISNLRHRIEKENSAWEYVHDEDRRGRLLNILAIDFNLYLNTYFRMSSDDQEEVWRLVRDFFTEKKEYLTPDLYPERRKELAKAILQDNRSYFEYAISRYLRPDPPDESYDDYIVFTHYHLYVAILRTLASGRKSRVYLGQFYTRFDTSLEYKIRRTGIFDFVKSFSYGSLVGNLFEELEERPGEEEIIIPNHMYRYFEDIFSECNKEKDVMHIFSDSHPYWYYVERSFENIVKLEDAYNSFDREVKTHKIAGIWAGIQAYEGKCYPKMFYKSEKISKYILSSMPEDIPNYYYEKIEIEDTKELDSKYREEMKKALLNIYDVDVDMFNENTVMLLTQPLAQFGYCTKTQQKYLMKRMCRGCSQSNLLIKPHPADTMNYKDLGGTILPKNVPIEVYNYLDIKIAQAVTFGSTAIETIEFAKEKKNYFKLHDIEFEEVVEAIDKMAPRKQAEISRITAGVKRRAKKAVSKVKS